MGDICCHCGDHATGTSCDIPKAPFYVVSVDRFMSGWGHASGRKNLCVVACPDRETAERVLRYVKSRSDQEREKITTFRPGEESDVLISNLHEWIETSEQRGF